MKQGTFIPFVVALFVIALLASAAAWTLPDIAEPQMLTVEQARTIVTPFYRALDTGNDTVTLINQATSPEWRSCSGNATCRSRDQVGTAIAGLHKTVPDLKWELKEVLVAGDRAIVRGEASGTPGESFMGVPPANRSFRVMSIDVHTIRDGKMTVTYHVEDWIGAVRQLSAQ